MKITIARRRKLQQEVSSTLGTINNKNVAK